MRFGGHEFDLSWSPDVGHVTIRFPMGHFLLVVLWNQAYITNGFVGFPDIQRRM